MAIELVVLLDSWKGSLKACEWEIDLAMLSDSETAKVSVHSWAHSHVPRLCPQNFRLRSGYTNTCRSNRSSHCPYYQEIGVLLLLQATMMNTDKTL